MTGSKSFKADKHSPERQLLQKSLLFVLQATAALIDKVVPVEFLKFHLRTC
jgi:hypothetical protein